MLATAATALAAPIGLSNAIGGAVVSGNFVVGAVGALANTNVWPTFENPSNAIDGNPAKYLNFAKLNTGLIVTPTGPNAGFAPTSMTVTTANDAIERDPASFTIYGSSVALSNATPGTSYSLAALTLIASGPLALPTSRLASSTVTFSNATAFASYLIVFPTVRDASRANSMQISELALDGVPPAAVPEPVSGLLMGLGVAAAAIARRRP